MLSGSEPVVCHGCARSFDLEMTLEHNVYISLTHTEKSADSDQGHLCIGGVFLRVDLGFGSSGRIL